MESKRLHQTLEKRPDVIARGRGLGEREEEEGGVMVGQSADFQ